jgi:hypothetical protein
MVRLVSEKRKLARRSTLEREAFARVNSKPKTHFQILARKSPLPVAKRPPVGLGATDITEFLWP